MRHLILSTYLCLTLLSTFCVSTALAQEASAPSEPAEITEEEEEAPAEATTATETQENNVGSLRRSNRMEFDARLVRGETAGSGAVFLFQRAPRALPSMVPLRKSYLHRSVQQVLTPTWTPPDKKTSTTATTTTILESEVVQSTTSSTSTAAPTAGAQEPSASSSSTTQENKATKAKKKKKTSRRTKRKTKKR